MARRDRILAMAKAMADKEIHRILDIPKHETTKGLDAAHIDILLSVQHKLFDTVETEVDVQVGEISSSEKKPMTRLRANVAKRNLFCKSGSEEFCLGTITSSAIEPQSEQFTDSEDEYRPDSEKNSESDSDISDNRESHSYVDILGKSGKNAYIEKELNMMQNNDIETDEALNLNEAPGTAKQKIKRVWNKRDHCYFCELDVLKFSRHILRHHQSEIEVQEILALNIKHKRRKVLFQKLRNKGNFLKSTISENVIPVRKPTHVNLDKPTSSTYLPCKFCKGFYKKKYLCRHIKKCPFNNMDKSERINAQSEGQSLFSTYRENDVLRKDIFPIMRADEISFIAKTDPLICAAARRYLKSHREKQFWMVASRKMRQLAHLLMEIKKKIKVKSLLSALDPQNFDVLVASTKKIARYDPETETYGAPSLALHMGTELKDCIDVAYNMILKKETTSNETSNNLKKLKELIISEWRYEISTIANNDLQQKMWNKPSLIPLAEDLITFKTYLISEGQKNRCILQQNAHDEKAFKKLLEVTYVQLLLLNRRRVGELQRMTLISYTSNINNTNSNEFNNCITESEKILMNSFKRIVIRGKRGRGVPVLFTENMVKNTDLLVQLRDCFVRKSNPYLFPNTKSTRSISGAQVVYKHVRAAGVKNAAALTSTKLRKHLATMSQLINLSQQDLEQLATFMGHTSDIHKTYYRLPNDVYQMAKVSKLLLLNEKGEASKYKGKSLDEININLNVSENDNSDVDSCDNDAGIVVNDEYDAGASEDENPDAFGHKLTENTKLPDKEALHISKAAKKPKRILQPWSEAQKKVALAYFKTHLRNKIPPKKNETLQLIDQNRKLFSNKSWEKIKIFIVNTYKKT